jgi:hypothetical protein
MIGGALAAGLYLGLSDPGDTDFRRQHPLSTGRRTADGVAILSG